MNNIEMGHIKIGDAATRIPKNLLSVGTSTAHYIVGPDARPIPMNNMTIDMQPDPIPVDLHEWQEGLRKMSEGLAITWQTITTAFTEAFKPFIETIKQFWSNWTKLHSRKRQSKQTRAFLAVKRGRQNFTPHAHKRRRSQRRVQIYQMKAI